MKLKNIILYLSIFSLIIFSGCSSTSSNLDSQKEKLTNEIPMENISFADNDLNKIIHIGSKSLILNENNFYFFNEKVGVYEINFDEFKPIISNFKLNYDLSEIEYYKNYSINLELLYGDRKNGFGFFITNFENLNYLDKVKLELKSFTYNSTNFGPVLKSNLNDYFWFSKNRNASFISVLAWKNGSLDLDLTSQIFNEIVFDFPINETKMLEFKN